METRPTLPPAARAPLHLALLASVAITACTTAMYSGPRRPEAQIAVIYSRDTRINYVDRKWVRDDLWAGSKAKYELLPGRHSVGISLEKRQYKVIYTKVQYSKTIVLCFDAEAGRRYLALALLDGGRWIPRIVDDAGTSVERACVSSASAAD